MLRTLYSEPFSTTTGRQQVSLKVAQRHRYRTVPMIILAWFFLVLWVE